MPTGLKQWASDQGLPVSLEAAIREQRANTVPPTSAEHIDEIVQFYKTNSAKKKQIFDDEFISILAEGKREEESKDDINDTLTDLIDEIVMYYNKGPDLPDSPINAVKRYLDKENADRIIEKWGQIDYKDRNDLMGTYKGLLDNPLKSKIEKEQAVRNFVFALNKTLREYLLPPVKKLLRDVLSQYDQLVGVIEDFYDRKMPPQLQQLYNEAILRAVKIKNGVEKDNELIKIVIRILNIYAQAEKESSVSPIVELLQKRIKPLEGQQKSAAQLQAEANEESKSEAQLSAEQNLLIAQQGATQQDAGLNTDNLLSAQGEKSRSPFWPVTNPEVVQILKTSILPINNKGQVIINKYEDVLSEISKLPQEIMQYTNDKGPKELITKYKIYDLQVALIDTLYDELGYDRLPVLNEYAIKRGFDDIGALDTYIAGKLAENDGIQKAYEGKGDKSKSFMERIYMLMDQLKKIPREQ